jgi:hypothetical protein
VLEYRSGTAKRGPTRGQKPCLPRVPPSYISTSRPQTPSLPCPHSCAAGRTHVHLGLHVRAILDESFHHCEMSTLGRYNERRGPILRQSNKSNTFNQFLDAADDTTKSCIFSSYPKPDPAKPYEFDSAWASTNSGEIVKLTGTAYSQDRTVCFSLCSGTVHLLLLNLSIVAKPPLVLDRMGAEGFYTSVALTMVKRGLEGKKLLHLSSF